MAKRTKICGIPVIISPLMPEDTIYIVSPKYADKIIRGLKEQELVYEVLAKAQGKLKESGG